MSTAGTSSNGHKAARRRPARDLRDRPLFRVAALVAVLLVAFVATKSCARQQHNISQDEAVAIAQKEIDFKPTRYQVKYLPQGVPPVYYWAVNFAVEDENGQVVHDGGRARQREHRRGRPVAPDVANLHKPRLNAGLGAHGRTRDRVS